MRDAGEQTGCNPRHNNPIIRRFLRAVHIGAEFRERESRLMLPISVIDSTAVAVIELGQVKVSRGIRTVETSF